MGTYTNTLYAVYRSIDNKETFESTINCHRHRHYLEHVHSMISQPRHCWTSTLTVSSQCRPHWYTLSWYKAYPSLPRSPLRLPFSTASNWWPQVNVRKITDQYTPTVFQSLGGALIVSAGQAIFQNALINAIPQTNPGLNPVAIFQVGTTKIRSTFSASELVGIDAAYMKGLHQDFALAILMAGIATLVTLTQPWFRVNKADKES